MWGLGGVLLLLVSPIWRLALVGLEAVSMPLTWVHWLALAAWVPFMAYSEGYRGFQKGFSPRVAIRAIFLLSNPTPLRTALAPLFCIGYFDIARRRQIAVIAVTSVVILFIVAVRLLPQPWRGLVDLGVVVGLGWGLAALLSFVHQGFKRGLDLPDALPQKADKARNHAELPLPPGQ